MSVCNDRSVSVLRRHLLDCPEIYGEEVEYVYDRVYDGITASELLAIARKLTN